MSFRPMAARCHRQGGLAFPEKFRYGVKDRRGEEEGEAWRMYDQAQVEDLEERGSAER